MEIKIYPTGSAFFKNTISGKSVNGIDLSVIPPSTAILPLPPELRDAGILAVHTDETGELFVTLQQACLSYEYPVTSHDWKESDWIPAEEFDPNKCYIIPLSVQGKTDYELVFRDTVEVLPSGVEVPRKGWTVVQTNSEVEK